MNKIVTVKDLDDIIASSTKSFSSKLDGKNQKITLCVCGGTGCLANSSEDIKGELVNYIGNLNKINPEVSAAEYAPLPLKNVSIKQNKEDDFDFGFEEKDSDEIQLNIYSGVNKKK